MISAFAELDEKVLEGFQRYDSPKGGFSSLSKSSHGFSADITVENVAVIETVYSFEVRQTWVDDDNEIIFKMSSSDPYVAERIFERWSNLVKYYA